MILPIAADGIGGLCLFCICAATCFGLMVYFKWNHIFSIWILNKRKNKFTWYSASYAERQRKETKKLRYEKQIKLPICTFSEVDFRVKNAKSNFVLAGTTSIIWKVFRDEITFIDPWKSVVRCNARFDLFSQIKPKPLNKNNK